MNNPKLWLKVLRIAAGLMDYTPAVREMFTRVARFSSNADASRAIQWIGFDYIARVLTSRRAQDTRDKRRALHRREKLQSAARLLQEHCTVAD